MSTSELVRPEYGTPDQRNRVTEVKRDGYTQRVLRDQYGRITGLEGRVKVDDLADKVGSVADKLSDVEDDTGELADRVDRLEASPSLTAALAECTEVVTQAEGRLVQVITSSTDALRASIEAPPGIDLATFEETIRQVVDQMNEQWAITVQDVARRTYELGLQAGARS